MSSPFHLMLACLIAISLFFIYKVAFKPIYLLRYYKKQGIKCFYHPFFGLDPQIHAAAKNTGDSFSFFKEKAKNNPDRLFAFNLYDRPIIIIHDPKLAQEVIMNIHSSNYIRDPWRIGVFQELFIDQIAMSYGEDWKKQKKFFSYFFQYDYISKSIPKMVDITQKGINFVRPAIPDGDSKLLLTQFFKKITGQIVCNMLFGKPESFNHSRVDGVPINIAITAILNDINVVNSSKETMLFGVGFVRLGLLKKHRILLNKISQVKQIFSSVEPLEGSVLYAMRQTSDYTEDEQIRQLISFYISSLDTIANSISNLVYFLWKNPECGRKIIEELNNNAEDADINKNPDEIFANNKQPYLQAAIKETFRLAPPGSALFPRKIVKEHTIGGDIKLQKGDMIQVEFFYNSYNPEYFYQPDEFKPERWLDKNFKIPPFAYTPFSLGPRVCIAQKFVTSEIKVVSSMILKAFRIEFEPNYTLELGIGAFNKAMKPMLVTFTNRA